MAAALRTCRHCDTSVRHQKAVILSHISGKKSFIVEYV